MTPDQLQARFSKRLRELREGSGMTQADLSDQTGIAHNHISQYENGHRMPSAYSLYLLAWALECAVDSVLGLDE